MTKIDLTSEQLTLHRRAVACGCGHRTAEAELVLALQEVGRTGLYRVFDCASLFAYAVRELGLTDSVAGQAIAVARKAALIPRLQEAIASRQLSVSLASRVVRCLKAENAEEVIAYALSHTFREVDEECARIMPRPDAGDGAKPTGDRRVKLTVTVSSEVHEALRRVQSLEAQCGRGAGMERALQAAAWAYLERRDPVRKAARAQAKAAPTRKEDPKAAAQPAASADPCAHRNKLKNINEKAPGPGRVPLTAAQKHAVHARDGGRCAHVGESGKRCASDRYVDVHHVRPVSRGGGNEPSNLTTLCSFHHDLVHQTSFPIEGQVSWIRARTREYVG